MHTLIYVDKQLTVAIANKLVGLSISKSKREGGGLSLNWLINSSYEVDETDSTTRDLREMLPEDVIHLLYKEIKHRYSSVSDAIQAFGQALSIQPYALINQRLILECTARLS